MVRSLLAASDQLQSSPCIAAYTDIVYSVDSVLALSCVDADIAITYDPDWRQLWSARFSDPLVDAETFRLSPDGRHLAAIGARPTSLADVEGQYMGLFQFAPAGWATVWELLALDMTSLLQRLIDEEVPVGVTPAPWPWAEIDTPENLHLYEHDPRFAPLRAMLSDAFSRHPPLVISSGGRDELFESFGWGLPVEGLAWSSVQFNCYGVELGLGVDREVGSFG